MISISYTVTNVDCTREFKPNFSELGLIIYNTVVAACAFDFVLLIMRTDLMLLKELKVNPHFPII